MAIPIKTVSYMKNVTKSIGYSAINAIKETNPAISAFVQNNSDVMKSTYKAIAHMDKTVSSASSFVLNSKAGELGKKAMTNIKEDLRTGKWYNRERKFRDEEAALSSFGFGGDDFGFEEMANGTFDFGEDSNDSIESMMDLVGEKSSHTVSEAIVRTTEHSINVQTQIARASAEQDRAIYANLHAAMDTINQNLTKLVESATGPITTHMENSKTFYENETRLSEERNAILKEMLEIQRSVYNKDKNNNSSGKISMSQIMDEYGMPELETYFERIKQNIKSMSAGTGDMAKSLMEGGVLDTLVSSPLEAVTNGIVKVLIPNTLKKTMKQFNNTLSGAFSSIMAKMMNSDSSNSIFNFVKSVFGINDSVKNDINVGKYEKGAVPFDGITRKSIVEVIPTYLARIEAAVSHKTERRFDYETGKFININEIKKNFDQIKKRSKDMANIDVNNFANKFLGAFNFGDNKERKQSILDNLDIIMDKSFKTGRIFSEKDMKKTAKELGLKGKDADNDLIIIRKMFETIPREAIMSYAKNVYEAKESINREMQRKEESGHDIVTALFNNSLDDVIHNGRVDNQTKIKVDTKSKQKNGKGSRGRAKAKANKNKKNKSSSSSKEDDSADDGGSSNTGGILFDDNNIETIAEQAAAAALLMDEDDRETLVGKIKSSEKVGSGIKKLITSVETLINKPTEFLSNIIKKADTAVYKMIFGVEYDEDGQPKSVSAAIFDGLKEQFKEFNTWLKKLFNPIREYFNREDTLGNKAKNFVKGIFDKDNGNEFIQRTRATFSGAKNYVKNTVKGAGRAVRDTIVEDLASDPDTYNNLGDLIRDLKGAGEIKNAASGMKKVTKTGVVAVSEGEMIIPPDMNPYNLGKRKKNEDKAKKSFIESLWNRIPGFAPGGVVGQEDNSDKKEEPKKEDEDLDAFVNKTVTKTWFPKFEADPVAAMNELNSLPKAGRDSILKILNKTSLKKLIDILKDARTNNMVNGIKNRVNPTIENIKDSIDHAKDGFGDKKGKDKMTKEQKGLINTALNQIREYAPEVAAGSLIGAGVSFLTGAIGGPLLGAAVGGGITLLKNSKAVSDMLFGEIGEDGKRQGSKYISKDMAQNIQKYAPNIGKGAILGSITSLLPFVPGGPVAGAILGSAIGFATKNEEIQNALFGDEGLFDKDFPDKVKKSLPVIGAGAAAGFVLGPFGTIPNILLGSAAGLATTTDKFKDIMFGELDDEGKRHGGVLENAVTNLFKPIGDFTKNTIIDLTKWADKNIKQPLADAIDPLKKQVQLMFEGIHKGINLLFKESLGATFDDMLRDYIFKPLSGFVKKITGAALAPIKFVVSAPFKLVGALGNSLRNRQIKHGNADYMTAEERLAFREKRGWLRNMNITNHARKWKTYDESLAGLSGQEANDLLTNFNMMIDNENTLKNSTEDAYNKFTKNVRKNKRLTAHQVNKIADKIKDFVNEGKGDINKVYLKASQYISKLDLSPTVKKDLLNSVNEYLSTMDDYHKRSKEFNKNEAKVLDLFEAVLGRPVNKKDLPKLVDYLKAEVKNKYNTGEEGEEGEGSNGDNSNSIESLNESQESRHLEIIDYLGRMADALTILTTKNEESIGEQMDILSERDEYSLEQGQIHRDNIEGIRGNIRDAASGAADRILHNRVTNAARKGKNFLLGDSSVEWRRGSSHTGTDILEEDEEINDILNNTIVARYLADDTPIYEQIEDEDSEEEETAEADETNPINKLNSTLIDNIRASWKNRKNREKNTKWEYSNGRSYKFIKDSNGDWIPDLSDADTKKSLEAVEKEDEEKKSFLKTLTDMPSNMISGMKRMFVGEEDEDKKNKTGLLGKIFGTFGKVKNVAGGLLGKGLAVVGIPLFAGLFKKFLGSDLGQTIKEKVKGAIEFLGIGEKIEAVKKGVVDWLSGEEDAIGGGLPGLIGALIDNWAVGFEFLCSDVLPKAIEIMIGALPKIIAAGIRGIGKILFTDIYNLIHPSSGAPIQQDNDFGGGGDGNEDSVSVDYTPVSSLSSHWMKGFKWNNKTYESGSNIASTSSGSGPLTSSEISLSPITSIINSSNNAINGMYKNVQNQEGQIDGDLVKSINTTYDNKLENGTVADYRDTEQYQSLAPGYQKKLDSVLNEMEDSGKNVIKINTGTAEDPKYQYMTLQELIASDTYIGTFKDKNGNPRDFTGKDLIDNPTLARELFGIDTTLTDEEAVQNAKDANHASIGGRTLFGRLNTAMIKSFLTGRTESNLALNLATKASAFMPFIGGPASLALTGANKLNKFVGKLGDAAMPDWLIGNYYTPEQLAKKKLEDAKKNKHWWNRMGNNLYEKLTGKGASEAAEEVVEEGMDDLTRNVLEQATEGAAQEAAEKAMKNGAEEAAENSLERAALNAADEQADGFIKTIINWAKKHIADMGANETILKYIADALKKLGKKVSKQAVNEVVDKIVKSIEKKAWPKFIKVLAKAPVKALGKVAAKIASGGLIGLLLDGYAFIKAFNNAEDILGIVSNNDEVDYDPSFSIKVLCGIAAFFNESLFQGFIPLDLIFDIVYEATTAVFGIDENDEDAKAFRDAREQSQRVLQDYANKTGEKLSIEEYNHKDELLYQAKNWAGKKVEEAVETFTEKIESGQTATVGIIDRTNGTRKPVWEQESSGKNASNALSNSKLSNLSSIIASPTKTIDTTSRNTNAEGYRIDADGNAVPYSGTKPSAGSSLSTAMTGFTGDVVNAINSGDIFAVAQSQTQIQPEGQVMYQTEDGGIVSYDQEGNTSYYDPYTGSVAQYDQEGTVTYYDSEGNEFNPYMSAAGLTDANIEDMSSSVEGDITTLLGDGKTLAEYIKKQSKETINMAKKVSNGKKYFSLDKVKDDDTGYGWVKTAVVGNMRFVSSPLAFTVIAGKEAANKLSNIISTGTGTATKILDDAKSVQNYMSNQKKIDANYWEVTTNGSSNGVFDSLERIFKYMNRLMMYPFVLTKNVLKDITEKSKSMIEEFGKDEQSSDKGKSVQANFTDMTSNAVNVMSNASSILTGTSSNSNKNEGRLDGSGTGLFYARGSNAKPKSDRRYAGNSAFVSQLDSRYASKSFNVSGDKEKQTIGDTGCGPAAAAMVVNNAYDGQDALNMKQASKDALKYKVKNGGVNASYFENEFTKYGLATEYIMDNDPAVRNKNIMSNLMSGNRTVLMGKDTSNISKANSPYGPNDHYIVATRVSKDGKYVWVNDPELKTPEVKYPTSTILNHTKMGVAGIAASGSGLLGRIHARGSNLKRRLARFNGRGSYGPDTVQYKVWNTLRAAGLGEIQVAGIMGNIEGESSFDTNCIEKGSGAGFGLCQWSFGRRTQIENYAASIGKDPGDLDLQLKFLLAELTKGGGCDGYANFNFANSTKEGQTWSHDLFMSTNDIDVATKCFCYCWERPGIPHMDRRLAAARKYYEEFTGSPVDSSAASGDSSSSNSGSSILDDIFGIFDELSVAYGLKSKGSSSNSSSALDTNSIHGGNQKQKELVAMMKSKEGTLKYAQNNARFPGSRNPDDGSGDCSSTVQWAYKKVLGVDPGSTSLAQRTDDDTYTVTTDFDESKMQPGDLILFNGHVEMYYGDGKMIGHGGGPNGDTLGPTVVPLNDQGRFLMVRRWKGFQNGGTGENYSGSGSGLLNRIHARGIGLNPNKEVRINDTVRMSNKNSTDKQGFLKKSRYGRSLKKNVKIPAAYYAAGSDTDNIITTVNKAPGTDSSYTSIVSSVGPNNGSSNINEKVSAYLSAILKLLSKEVENTSMLSTIVAILTELVKISEEERSLNNKSGKDIEQKKIELDNKRLSMMNILKATGIQNNSSNELTKLMRDAERLARL